MMIENKTIRWGILGAANIAKERLIPAMLEAKNTQVLAIASRSEDKAKKLAEQFNIPRAYGSYDELLKDKNINAVYIPLPNHLHAEWTIKASKAGKHILCEKPAALNEKEAVEMVTACQENNVLFMEAFAFRCHPQWHRLREILDSGYIGDIRNVQARFAITIDNDKDIRLDLTMGGGSLYDLGSYCINGIRFIMNNEPLEVIGLPQITENGVDLSIGVLMKFSEGRIAQFDCSFEGEYNQSIGITGTKGLININWPFRNPTMTIQKNGMVEREIFEFQLNTYVSQVEHFNACILGKQSLIYDAEQTLANMRVIDAIYGSTKIHD